MTCIPAGARAFTLVAAVVAGPIASVTNGARTMTPASPGPSLHAVAAAGDSTSREVELAAAGRRFAAAVRHCYSERGLKEDPSMGGLLRVRLTVLPAGDVRDATATATRVHGLGMPAVTACVATAAGSWRFKSGAPRAERVVLWFDLLPPSS